MKLSISISKILHTAYGPSFFEIPIQDGLKSKRFNCVTLSEELRLINYEYESTVIFFPSSFLFLVNEFDRITIKISRVSIEMSCRQGCTVNFVVSVVKDVTRPIDSTGISASAHRRRSYRVKLIYVYPYYENKSVFNPLSNVFLFFFINYITLCYFICKFRSCSSRS